MARRNRQHERSSQGALRVRGLAENLLRCAGIRVPANLPSLELAKLLADHTGIPPEVPWTKAEATRYLERHAQQSKIKYVSTPEKRKEQPQPKTAPLIVLPRQQPPQHIDHAFILSKEFYLSKEWEQLRYRALLKHGRRCMCCGATPKQGITLHVDHVKPRSRFPEIALVLDNLQVLCETCNRGKGAWDQTDFRDEQSPPHDKAASR